MLVFLLEKLLSYCNGSIVRSLGMNVIQLLALESHNLNVKQVTSLSLLNDFLSSDVTPSSKETESDELLYGYVLYGFGHSLWSANQLASARVVNRYSASIFYHLSACFALLSNMVLKKETEFRNTGKKVRNSALLCTSL